MPTGVTSAWGYPINAIGGQIGTMVKDNRPLTYQLSLTSSYPTFSEGIFQSPLTGLTAFGARYSKKVCKLFLKNKSRNPVSGRKIKRSGQVFKNLMKQCEKYGLVKTKKKL